MNENYLAETSLFRRFPIINQNSVKTQYGEYIGAPELETGVLSFKGIPFAQSPVGDLRWLPPQELSPSNEKFYATQFGDVPLQVISDDDIAKNFETSEDILKLNIWTNDLYGKDRPVMVYIHGGSYGWEAAAFPEYNGQFIVEQNPDIIVVTFDYRVNTLGFADLQNVDGYTDKYQAAQYLGLLDDIAALKWVNENIENFGGDPNNITIFGESAGGGSVSALLASPLTAGLFDKVIAQSGALNLTYSQNEYTQLDQVGELMKVTGAKNIDDLIALTPEQILQAWQVDTNKIGPEGGTQIQSLQGFPLRGGTSIVPENPYAALENGVNKDVPLLIGTTTDEWRYWIEVINDWTGNLDAAFDEFAQITANKAERVKNNQVSPENQQYLEAYFASLNTKDDIYAQKYENIWKNTELVNDIAFRMPAIKQAQAHVKGGGETYMYYFGKESDANDWIGAAHASELNYVFHNLDLPMTYTGTVDPVLAKKIVTMWANFARTGDPSIEGFYWQPYDLENKATMIVGKNGEIYMENNPKALQTELLDKTGIAYEYTTLTPPSTNDVQFVDYIGTQNFDNLII